MKTILWLAPYVPYKKVNHAGGKNLYNYITYINNTGEFDISFIGLGYEYERPQVDLEQNGIKANVYYRDCSKVDFFIRRIVSGFTLINPWSKYCQLLLMYEHMQMRRMIREYKDNGGKPEIIILHWTAMGLMIDELKREFPEAAYVIVEEDVTYLSYSRKYLASKKTHNPFKQLYWRNLSTTLKVLEHKAILRSDVTVTINDKDRKLLIDDGIMPEKLFSGAVCFDAHYDVVRKPDGNMVLFYGSMERAENYLSAKWFIEEVMPLIRNNTSLVGPIKFYVVGAKPPELLLNMQSDDIIVTGFVDDVEEYFSKAVCMVAPLVLGAGVKVKVLEAMSAGIPVITNQIGIEGINACPNEEYIHCEEPSEYNTSVCELINNSTKALNMGEASKRFIQGNYDNSKALAAFGQMLKEL